MAGIGFRLQEMLSKGGILRTLSAFVHGAFISCGPWLATMAIVVVLGFWQTKHISVAELTLFRTTIVYIFAASLIMFGIIQMPLTRHLADLLFKEDFGHYLTTYFEMLVWAAVLVFSVGFVPCFFLNEWSMAYRINAFMALMAITYIWVAMVFLSAAKQFYFVSLSFVIAAVVAIVFGVSFGALKGLEGYMAAFSMSQVVLFFILTYRLLVEFPSQKHIEFDVIKSIRSYPALILIGLFYNLGIWIDKIVYWVSPEFGQNIDAFLYASFVYDQPMFLAYLTVIPTYAMFLVKMETEFFQRYRGFYLSITEKKSYPAIQEIKKRILLNSKDNIWFIIKIQGVFSIIILLFATSIAEYLKLNWTQVIVFRVAILATFLHALLLVMIIFVLYFDFRKESLVITGVFLFLNGLFSYISTIVGFPFIGFGYLMACVCTLIVGMIILDHKMRYLEFYTFMDQEV